ncbi:MAG TPA: hypothetical protein PKN32_08305 [Bacteroidales bacterium]|nr:hypothetical protein [Bacteroidales bacterium]
MKKFTKQQVDFIFYQIEEWYLDWKKYLVDYDKFEFAKEELKARICGKEYENLEDENDHTEVKFFH